MMDLKLNGCEAAALIHLVGTNTGMYDAKELIPSLSKFRDTSIDEILDLIKTTMIRIIS